MDDSSSGKSVGMLTQWLREREQRKLERQRSVEAEEERRVDEHSRSRSRKRNAESIERRTRIACPRQRPLPQPHQQLNAVEPVFPSRSNPNADAHLEASHHHKSSRLSTVAIDLVDCNVRFFDQSVRANCSSCVRDLRFHWINATSDALSHSQTHTKIKGGNQCITP